MWEYTKIIPMSVLRRQYPSASYKGAMSRVEREFAQECSEVLGKAMKYEVTEDPQSHGVRLTATLITEPKEADMGTMGAYGAGNWVAVDGEGEYSYTDDRAAHAAFYGDKKRTPRLPSKITLPFRDELRDEINEWLKM